MRGMYIPVLKTRKRRGLVSWPLRTESSVSQLIAAVLGAAVCLPHSRLLPFSSPGGGPPWWFVKPPSPTAFPLVHRGVLSHPLPHSCAPCTLVLCPTFTHQPPDQLLVSDLS